MRRLLLPLLATLTVVALAALLAACSDSTDPDTAPTGHLVLKLTDASCGFDSVVVSVVGVSAHRAGADGAEGSWLTVSDDTFTVDLLTLSGGQSVTIADTLVPAGKYTQVRLHLDDGSYAVVAGETHALTVPSGSTSGLKLNHPFALSPDGLHTATLDFDACRSVHRTGMGEYVLEPVIRIVADADAGGLSGTVLPPAARALVWAVADDDSALALADTLTGEFLFTTLPAGTYDVSFAPSVAGWADSTVAGVPVVVGEVTDLVAVELLETAGP